MVAVIWSTAVDHPSNIVIKPSLEKPRSKMKKMSSQQSVKEGVLARYGSFES